MYITKKVDQHSLPVYDTNDDDCGDDDNDSSLIEINYSLKNYKRKITIKLN